MPPCAPQETISLFVLFCILYVAAMGTCVVRDIIWLYEEDYCYEDEARDAARRLLFFPLYVIRPVMYLFKMISKVVIVARRKN